MRIKEVTYSPHFKRAFKKLERPILLAALEREKIFRNNCFDVRLKTHKLAGSLKDCWSFSIAYSYRILFKFAGNGRVEFIDVGNHSIYQ